MLKNEVEELEELEKQKENFYGLERRKMESFQAQVDNFVVDCQMQVQELRNKINEVKDTFHYLALKLVLVYHNGICCVAV